MSEHDALVGSYQHLENLPRASEALHTLRKISSLVKPIMRKRGWRVGTLKEFFPDQKNLLGLNIDRGRSICLRLRHAGDSNQFLPLEDVVDTMLHELSHNIHGPHDEKFHALWNELRDEYMDLKLKGYSGEGFLSNGHRLGGRRVPMHELRRNARAEAEKRKAMQALQKGSGQKLGGAPVLRGVDMRNVIADAVTRRINITKGCASGTQGADQVSKDADRNGFRTKAEEDDANDRAIAQALWELVQEEEARKAGVEPKRTSLPSDFEPNEASNAKGQSRKIDDSSSRSRSASPNKNGPFAGPSTSRQPPAPFNSKVTSNAHDRESRPKSRLISEDEARDRSRAYIDLISSDPEVSPSAITRPSTWTCEICTLVNPTTFLCCDACGIERPSSINLDVSSSNITGAVEKSTSHQAKARAKTLGWNCTHCGSWHDHQWWTCSNCGRMKESSTQ